MNAITGRMLILGHGYTAGYLSPLLLAKGWQVTGTTRSNRARISARGAVPLLWPGEDDAVAQAIGQADAILVSAGPGAEGDPVLAEFAGRIAASPARWIGYLSTTGVYGDRQGDWVDEETALAPSTQRGAERVRAEAEWQALAEAHNLPLHIFRLAGIYGPGRGPFAKLTNGTARRIVKPGQIFSRIHVEDIAQVLLASIEHPAAAPGRIYNVCDNDPAPPEDVIAHAAGLIGLPPPPLEAFDTAEMTEMARSFYADSKRVSNRRILDELGVHLRYGDYRAGLAALAASEGNAAA
ncbi:SDR family oxidoreductase [Paracoccus aminophilus]|uniref:NAD-dependent epimerase/dehydratase n=1 Tax=Paracoccus aminophilus JCM 7686 TaxID=1367847 RepID=S5XVE7_PARAH|nr:SDR family oxidoreductase [Paracoccus aminophilus]AGT07345.1 NAD-dependent epimerase/dehydratase [Paracoccus aminophilus JCM 7686]